MMIVVSLSGRKNKAISTDYQTIPMASKKSKNKYMRKKIVPADDRRAVPYINCSLG
jgi:hypothetical protein